jgi:class 3 adenylate cyclase
VAPGPGEDRPEAFGRYQVRRAFGAGGFGTVYLGHDTQLDRPVAIKVQRGDRDVPSAEVEQFLQEARRLARLRHPGIVAVHDAGAHEGQVYLVSDFLDGPSLEGWLKANRPSCAAAARLAAAVADALAHAHARRIVHRDVKPANLLLTADGAPVLVDFGLALDETRAGGPEFGVVSGTPAYMSPEQVAGAAHRIDGRTDIYSLGVVLYEMLCGQVPFRSADTRELLRQVRDDEPQPPRQLVPDIPPELERVCLKALAKRIQDRYTTAADFADDLRRAARADELSPQSAAADSWEGGPVTPPSRRPAREAERRQVTVLVCGCDLFESEAYLERLDAEDQAGLLRDFQQVCQPVVGRLVGTVVQCNAEGLLVCFGYPVAHEDSAQCAARAGLDVLEALTGLGEQLRRQRGLELKPWIGLHTGPAVVEAGVDAVGLAGEARNVAVRLGAVAEPGRVVCTEATHRLIQGHFDCAGLGRRKLRGVPRPVGLFRVLAAVPVHNPIEDSQRVGLTPLTGRDHEVSLLTDRWEQAQEGMGQVVLVIGEPGLGKSRLVYTLKQHVRGQGGEASPDAPVIEWRCSPHYQNTGLYPAGNFFERFLGFGRDDAPAARFDRLVRHLEKYDLARPDPCR